MSEKLTYTQHIVELTTREFKVIAVPGARPVARETQRAGDGGAGGGGIGEDSQRVPGRRGQANNGELRSRNDWRSCYESGSCD